MRKILSVYCLLIGLTTASYAQQGTKNITDPVEKAKGLQKQLKLTDHQTTTIAAIYKESAEKFDKIRTQEKGDNNKMLVAIRPLRAQTIKKIKAVLTPAQSAKYDRLLRSNTAPGGSGWGDGWSSAS